MPVGRFRGRNQEKKECSGPHRIEQAVADITSHKARVGICRPIGEFRQGERVHLVQEVQDRHGSPKTHGKPHGQAAAVDETANEHDRHPQHFIDQLCHVIARAELFIVAAPLLGNLEELLVARHLVAVNLSLNAPTAVPELHALLLPGERMVGARGALVAFRLRKLEVTQVALHHFAQESLSNHARCCLVEIGAGCRFRNCVLEAHHLARGGHVHAELFYLLRLEPAMRPAPKPDRSSRQLVHAVQALGALEVDFGVIIVGKNGGVEICVHAKAAVAQKLRCQRRRVIAVDAQIDGCFWESTPEVLEADTRRQGGDYNHKGDDPILGSGQSDGHEIEGEA